MKKSIKQEVVELPPQVIIPDIKLEPVFEPIIEVNTPSIDMIPIANAIKAMQTKVEVIVPEQSMPNIKLHFERDSRGFIKSPITIEREYDR